MKHGEIKCNCGQYFYFETVNTQVECINCGKIYDVSSYPDKEEVVDDQREEG